MSNEMNMYPIQVARALMALNRLAVHDIAERAYIQLENIEAFLSGFPTVISDPSMDKLFGVLGMNSKGLDKERVHFWHMDVSRTKNKRNLLPLVTLLPLIGEHSAMTLQKQGRITPVLIKGQDIRIVLFVKTPYFVRVTPEDLGLTPGSFDGVKNVNAITRYYQNIIFEQKLRINYFDLILKGDFRTESFELLRMAALEYDITITDLLSYVTNKREVELEDSAMSVLDYSDSENIIQFISKKAVNS